ncbi:MAG: hypothetical protein WCW65_02690 [Candidatus Paceibacterota bacterium]
MKKAIILFVLCAVALFAAGDKQIKYKYRIYVELSIAKVEIYYTDKYDLYTTVGYVAQAWVFTSSFGKRIVVPINCTVIEEQ